MADGEVKFIDYKIGIPGNAEYGTYKGQFQFYDYQQEIDAKEVDGLSTIFANGFAISLEITDMPADYNYGFFVSDPKEFAKQELISDIRYILMYVFGFVSIYFLFKCFKSK